MESMEDSQQVSKGQLARDECQDHRNGGTQRQEIRLGHSEVKFSWDAHLRMREPNIFFFFKYPQKMEGRLPEHIVREP